MLSSLHVPVLPDERDEPGFSGAVAAALERAYFALARGKFDLAQSLIRPYFPGVMSNQQRLRVCYVLALTYLAACQRVPARALLDEALELSLHLKDLRTCVELAHLQATSLGDSQLYAAALAYLTVALDALAVDVMDYTGTPAMVGFELNLRLTAASYSFLVGEYTACIDQLRAAHALTRALAATPSSALSDANIEWLAALVERWRGNSPGALDHASRALDTYATFAAFVAPSATTRLRVVVADLHLDVATDLARLGRGQRYHHEMELARSHLAPSLADNDASGDPTGRCLVRLSAARLNRLAGVDENRVLLIEGVAATARREDDVPLLGQALAALGDEMLARREMESALTCYRRALSVLEHSQAPAMAVFARRALLLAQEFGEM